MTHLRERLAANGDTTEYFYFCSEGCWRDSFDAERLGPESDTFPRGGAAPGAAGEPGTVEEIHCAECGVLMASPYRLAPTVVNLAARPPLDAHKQAFPVDVLYNPLLEAAWAEHHVGSWTYEGGTLDDPTTYRLDCWWSGKTDGPRAVVAYVLRANNTTIFSGEDYKPSPMYGPDSTGAIADLLGFLSCKPGDTDAEFFANYTREQLAFAEAHGEELALWSNDLEGEQ